MIFLWFKTGDSIRITAVYRFEIDILSPELPEADQFRIRPTRTGKSPKTNVTYGIDWEMEVPEQGISLQAKACLNNQEMKIFPVNLWTGACDISGAFNGQPVTGRGFLETWGDYRAPFRNMYRSGMDVSR